MSDQFGLSAGRDWRTPMPLTGKAYVKTYYDWNQYCWRIETCILIGAREEAPSVAWADRLENRGKGRAPDRPRRDLSPQGTRQDASQRTALRGTRRQSIRQLLRERGQATTVAIAEALGMSVDQASAALKADPLAMPQLKKPSRNNPQVWVLLEEEAPDELAGLLR